MGYRDQRGEMKNDLVAVHEAANERCIADVATDEIDFSPDRLRQFVQPAVAVEGIVLSKSRYFASGVDERFCQVRTNEAVRSCHEDLRAIVARRHRCARLIFRFGSTDDRDPVRSVTLPRSSMPLEE